jgi:hypothetical protein
MSTDDKHYGDPNYWHCRDGRILKIAEMDTNHLRATVNYLKRQGVQPSETPTRKPLPPFPSFGGEYAQEAAEQEWMTLASRAGRSMTGMRLHNMLAELKKREASVIPWNNPGAATNEPPHIPFGRELVNYLSSIDPDGCILAAWDYHNAYEIDRLINHLHEQGVVPFQATEHG